MTNSSSTIATIFESFDRLRVLVIGDVMVDHYVFGNVNRISPEAPIPIVDVYRQEKRLGGAANVALNVKALGAHTILAAVVGDDDAGHTLKSLLAEQQIDGKNVVLDQERKTTVKTRVIAKEHQIMRYDAEQENDIDEKTELLLLDNIIDCIYNDKPNVVILQDYNKGLLTPKVIANVIHNCQQANIPVAVDPKAANFFAYKGCTLFKPNLKEASAALQLDLNPLKPESLFEADRRLRATLENAYTVITLSEKGIYVGDKEEHDILPAYAEGITDVSGAGDTVISLLSLGLALGLDIFATAELANIAAAMVCGKVGVCAINKAELYQEAEFALGGVDEEEEEESIDDLEN